MFPLEPTLEEVAATRAERKAEESLTDATPLSWGFPNATTEEGPILPTESLEIPGHKSYTTVLEDCIKEAGKCQPKGRSLCQRPNVGSVRHSRQNHLLASSGKRYQATSNGVGIPLKTKGIIMASPGHSRYSRGQQAGKMRDHHKRCFCEKAYVERSWKARAMVQAGLSRASAQKGRSPHTDRGPLCHRLAKRRGAREGRRMLVYGS